MRRRSPSRRLSFVKLTNIDISLALLSLSLGRPLAYQLEFATEEVQSRMQCILYNNNTTQQQQPQRW